MKKYWPTIRDYALIVLGALVQAVSLRLFFVPAKLASGGVSGGSDILARILNSWRGISMTQSYLTVDTAVILSAGFIFGWKQALYAMITLYVSGLVSETVLEGGGTARTAMIITSQPEAVSHRVIDDLERGVTFLEGTGAYSGTSRPVLNCVISRAEVATLKAIVRELDPEAFMVIGAAHEALGKGFRALRAQ